MIVRLTEITAYTCISVFHRMSRLDIKQYLEKIYKVPVLRVNTEIRQGTCMAFSLPV